MDDIQSLMVKVQKIMSVDVCQSALGLGAVVKITTHVVDHDAEKLNIIVEEFKKMWPDKNFPLNTLIPVPKLALENMLVEIDAVAIKK